MPQDPSESLHGRYRIEGLLGEGGMGAVYRAFDSLFDRPCAVKQLRLGLIPTAAELGDFTDGESHLTREAAARQFKREAKILAEFDHPNLPKVVDYFIVGVSSYLVMTLIEGTNLLEMLETRGWTPFPEAIVLTWVKQVMDALNYCHQRGIIHRDIKPSNLINAGNDKIFLVDFGIAKNLQSSSQTPSGITQMITPRYSAPEQCVGESGISPCMDVYSLGATMFTLLTGQLPYESIARLTGAEMQPPRSINPKISEQVSRAVMTAMELKPNRRFRDIHEFHNAVFHGAAPIRTFATVATLTIISGPSSQDTGKEFMFEIREPVTKIGRQSSKLTLDLAVDLKAFDIERVVSRHHMTIEQIGALFFLSDNNSRNGTWLNQTKIEPGGRYPLKDGDLIQVGSTRPHGIKLKFMIK